MRSPSRGYGLYSGPVGEYSQPDGVEQGAGLPGKRAEPVAEFVFHRSNRVFVLEGDETLVESHAGGQVGDVVGGQAGGDAQVERDARLGGETTGDGFVNLVAYHVGHVLRTHAHQVAGLAPRSHVFDGLGEHLGV